MPRTRTMLFSCCLLLFLLGVSASVQSAGLVLVKGKAALENNGSTQPLPAEEFEVMKSTGGTLRFVTVSEDQLRKRHLKMGLYLFTAEGQPAGFIAGEAASFCHAVFLSPDQKILLMDSGTWLVRNLTAYSFPELKALRKDDLSYFSSEGIVDVAWNGNDAFLFNTLEESGGRTCDYDPCGPISVHQYSFATGKETTLKAGTALCDHTLQGVKDGSASIGSRCMKNVKDWKKFPEHVPYVPSTLKLN